MSALLRDHRCALGLCAGLAAILIAGCGGGGYLPDASVRPNATVEETLLPIAEFPSGTRFMDIADTDYSVAWRSTYLYGQTVTASFDSPADQLAITVLGGGLKPNHAYQVKLEGLPDIDPTANQTLKALGRTWFDLGYLVFGFVITDENGNIAQAASSQVWPNTTIPVDCSYHVLWKTSQRDPSMFDGPVMSHTVVRQTPYYDSAGTGPTVGIYAEWESGKPTPGTLTLPDGDYTVVLRLTEESFHSTDPDGGNWTSVLEKQISFTIDSGGEPPPAGSGTIRGTISKSNGRVATKAAVTLSDQWNQEPDRTVTADRWGAYSFADVPEGSGRYTVSAQLKRGSSGAVTDVTVEANATTVINVTLSP